MGEKGRVKGWKMGRLVKWGMIKGGQRGRVNSGKKGEDQGWEKEVKGWGKGEGLG